MPLEKGKSKEVFSRNLQELLKSGYKKDQALAIAYSQKGEKKGKPKKEKK